MKKNYLLLFMLLFSLTINAQYDHQNISLLGHWFNPAQVAEPSLGIKYNSVWGWVNPKTNTEYAILGSGSGTHIINISNPGTPYQVAFVAGRRDKCIWREYKTYKNYLYAISDDGAPNSLQIMDMSYLPDSVHVVYDADSLIQRAHTLFVDGDKLYVASIKPVPAHPKFSMGVFSLSNPERPVLLRTLNEDAPAIEDVHDMLVRNDTVYTSCGNTGLFIYLYDTIANKFSEINAIPFYNNQGYNHSSALTKNGKTLIFCDEVPRNMFVKSVDVSDIKNVNINTLFKSTEGATAHNPYINNNTHVIIAYYQDGIQIFDIRDPKTPVRRGYFDTDTIDGISNNYNKDHSPYHGCWGAYIDLPSGNLLASDMQNGLFVLNASTAFGIDDPVDAKLNNFHIYPNPVQQSVTIQFNLTDATSLLFEVLDITGRKLYSKTEDYGIAVTQETINMESFCTGMYLLKISGKKFNYTSKILKN